MSKSDIDWPARVLVQTPTLVVIDKPPGLETVVAGSGDRRLCMSTAVRRVLGEAGLAPVHRLDRDTSGCVLMARSPQHAPALEELFRGRQVSKHYLGICVGVPRPSSGLVKLPLSPWRPGRTPVSVMRGRGGLPASTAYRVLASGPARIPQRMVSLVLFELHTGRTHQIRVHAAELHCPILGDDQYGDRAANRAARDATGLRRQALHAWKLDFDDPAGGHVAAKAPLPDDLAAVLTAWLPEAIKHMERG